MRNVKRELECVFDARRMGSSESRQNAFHNIWARGVPEPPDTLWIDIRPLTTDVWARATAKLRWNW